jgi:hypothetical protein
MVGIRSLMLAAADPDVKAVAAAARMFNGLCD